eukprot:4832647-Alexandrium_andersonii.AAC.1
MGYCGAVSTLRMLEVPISPQQLVVCENTYRANVWARVQTWLGSLYELLDFFLEHLLQKPGCLARQPARIISFEIHAVRGD